MKFETSFGTCDGHPTIPPLASCDRGDQLHHWPRVLRHFCSIQFINIINLQYTLKSIRCNQSNPVEKPAHALSRRVVSSLAGEQLPNTAPPPHTARRGRCTWPSCLAQSSVKCTVVVGMRAGLVCMGIQIRVFYGASAMMRGTQANHSLG